MKRRRVIIVASALLAGLALTAHLLSPPDTNLFPSAQIVMDNSDLGPRWDYVWLSNHEVEAFEYSPSGKWKLVSAYTYHTSTAARTRDSLFTNELLKDNLGANDIGWALSPDGTKLLGEDPANSRDCVFRNRHLACEAQGMAQFEPVWLDNSRWVGMENDRDGSVEMGLNDTVGHRQRFTFDRIRAPGDDHALLIGAKRDGNLVLGRWPFFQANRMVHVITCLPDANAPVTDYVVRLPAGTSIGQENFDLVYPFLSPDGCHIAWPVNCEPRPLAIYPGWVQRTPFARLLWRLNGQSNPDEALWISNTDGSHMRLAGAWNSYSSDAVSNLQWLPDSRHISFTRTNGRLYMVDLGNRVD